MNYLKSLRVVFGLMIVVIAFMAAVYVGENLSSDDLLVKLASRPDFLLFLGLVAVVIIVVGFWRWQWELVTGLLVSLGIAGTFYGVFTALNNADWKSDNLPGEIPALLDGVGIALASSVLGIGIALFIRLLSGLGSPRATTGERLLSALHDQNETIERHLTDQTNLLRVLLEYTETEQKLERERHEEVSKQQAQLIKSAAESQAAQELTLETLKGGLRELSERSVDVIVDALREIVENYDQHIQEQLGESFFELRVAVEELTTWQRDHLEEIRSLHSILQQTSSLVEALEGGARTHADLLDYSDQMLGSIQQVVTKINSVVEEVEERLDEVEDAALYVIESLVERYEAASADVEARVLSTVDRITEGFDKATQIHASATIQSAEDMSAAVLSAGTSMEAEARKAAKHLSTAIEELFSLPERQREKVEELLTDYGRELEKITATTLSSIAKKLEAAIDKGLQSVTVSQENLLSSFERLHGLVGDLNDGAKRYSNSVTEAVTQLTDVNNHYKTSLSTSAEKYLQEVSNALAHIHEQYFEQFVVIEKELGALRANGADARSNGRRR